MVAASYGNRALMVDIGIIDFSAKVGKIGEQGKENRREDTRKEQTVQTHRRQQGKDC